MSLSGESLGGSNLLSTLKTTQEEHKLLNSKETSFEGYPH